MLLAAAMTSVVSCRDGGGGASAGTTNAAAGRTETRAVKALDAVGYNGGQLRGKLDAALDKNDQRNKAIEQAGP